MQAWKRKSSTWPLSSKNDTQFRQQKSPRTHLGTPWKHCCLRRMVGLLITATILTSSHTLPAETNSLWSNAALCGTCELSYHHPDGITWRPSWNCTHEISSPQLCLVAENRSGDWKGYPWMSTVQQNPQGSSSLTASSMVLADSSRATCSRRFCHLSGKTLPHHGRRPL